MYKPICKPAQIVSLSNVGIKYKSTKYVEKSGHLSLWALLEIFINKKIKFKTKLNRFRLRI